MHLKPSSLVFLSIKLSFLILSLLTQSQYLIAQETKHHSQAKHAMVATRDSYASNVGLDILKQGGNAIDAAIAIGYALAVTNPIAGNLGGGGFMMIYLAKEDKVIAIDYRETAPIAAKEDLLLDKDGNYSYTRIKNLNLTSGIPGTVAGLEYAREHYGSLSRKTLINPAYTLAKKGFTVQEAFHKNIKKVQADLRLFPSSSAVFLPKGKPPKIGSTFKQHDLAKTLKRLIKHGKKDFYEGATAQKIVSYMNQNQGLISLDDLKNYTVVERAPIKGNYRGYSIYSMPPPSSGGIHLIQILNMLEYAKPQDLSQTDYLHLIAEITKRAYADRSLYLGDPDFVDVPIAELISKAYAKKRFNQINLKKATPSKDIYPGLKPSINERFETTHFSVIDKDGNMVANTYTLNAAFGNKHVVKGAGFFLNNELDDFSAKPGTPNLYGLVGSKANKVDAKKRPLSSMSPTLILKEGKPFLATGARGGSRIITTVAQLISNTIDFNQSLDKASIAPRIHHQWKPDILFYEPGLSKQRLNQLKKKGHILKERSFLATTNSIMKTEDHLQGFASNRIQNNLAIGY